MLVLNAGLLELVFARSVARSRHSPSRAGMVSDVALCAVNRMCFCHCVHPLQHLLLPVSTQSRKPSGKWPCIVRISARRPFGMLLAYAVWPVLLASASSAPKCAPESPSGHQEDVLLSTSVADLRRLIISCGLRVNDCIEKSDLIDRAREAIAKKAHGGCLQQNWTNGRAPKLDAKSTQPPSHKSGKHIKSFKKRTPASGNSRNSGLKLSLLPQSQAQATAAPTQVLRRLIRHFGWSSDAFVDKTALLQRALQALAQPKALPKPHRIQHQGHAAHVLTPKLLKKTAGSLPLLFVLHGAGRTKASVESSVLQFSKMSSRNKILIAIPMSIDRTWDLRQTATTGQASADAAFISYILDCLNRDYYIDSGRIAVMGFSDGGSYAISLAVNNPEVFQAAMSWSAGYYLESRHSGQAAPTRSKPNILHGHGQVDELFDFQKVAVPMRQSLRSSGHLVTPHNVRSAGHAAPPDFAHFATRWWLDLPPVEKAHHCLGSQARLCMVCPARPNVS